MSGADMFGFQKTLDWTESFQPDQRETNKWSQCKLLKWFARLGWFQLAFPRDALVLFLGALDAIFALAIAIREDPLKSSAPGLAGSLRLDVSRPDHPAPCFDLGRDPLGEFLGRAPEWLKTEGH